MKKIYKRKRKVPEDYHELAQKRDFEWLGPRVFNTHTKTWWRCPKGHEWEAIYDSLRDGSGCPFCAGNRPKKSVDYHILARKMGLKWLGPKVSSVNIKTGWECVEGHRWEAAYSTIQQGHSCLCCSGKAPKSPTDYRSLAKECNYKWCGPFPINARTKTKWQCEKGHMWMSSYNGIQQGNRCRHCAGQMPPKIPADYYKLAKEHNVKWLGPEASNTRTKTKWECVEGHKWEARYDSIKGGHGCPYCVDMVNGARISKIQEELCRVVGGVLNYPCNPYRIDVALPDRKIAIEYDGWYWHGNRQGQDVQRSLTLIDRGWKVLCIKSNERLPSKQQIDEALVLLESGKNPVNIVLDDWGRGPCFSRV